MKEFNIKNSYLQKQRYKIWALTFALFISFSFGIFGPIFIGFCAMIYIIKQNWSSKHLLIMLFLIFGFMILMSIVYSNTLIFGILGLVAIGYIIKNIWKDVYDILSFSILGDKDGIWLKNKNRSNSLIKWEDMRYITQKDSFLDIEDESKSLLIKLSKHLEFYDKLKDLILKNINNQITKDEIKTAFNDDQNKQDKKFPLLFSSGEFYDFSVKTFIGLLFTILLGAIILYLLDFTIYAYGVGFLSIFFIFFLLVMFWDTPKRLEIFADRLVIFYALRHEVIKFKNIKTVDLLKFSSRKDNATSKVRIITKDDRYFTIYDFYQDDEEILKAIKQTMKN